MLERSDGWSNFPCKRMPWLSITTTFTPLCVVLFEAACNVRDVFAMVRCIYCIIQVPLYCDYTSQKHLYNDKAVKVTNKHFNHSLTIIDQLPCKSMVSVKSKISAISQKERNSIIL